MGHRRGDRRVDRGDPLVHRLGDGAVGRVALAAGAQLDQVHRLAGVQVEHVADPVAEAERVGRGVVQARRPSSRSNSAREISSARSYSSPTPGLADLLRDAGAEVGPEPLPLAGQHPVALQVAEAAVVGDDLEAVADRLPAAARAVAAVGALAGQLADQLGALERVEGVDPVAGSRASADRGRLEQRGGEQVLLAAVDVRSARPTGASPTAGRSRPSRATARSVASRRSLQVGDPLAAAVGPLDPGDEARHHLARARRGSSSP